MLTLVHRPQCIKIHHQTLRSKQTSSPVIIHRSRQVTNTTQSGASQAKNENNDPNKKKISKRLAEEKITFPCTPVAYSSNLFQQFQNQTVERDFNVFKVQYEQKLLEEWKEVSALREHAAQIQKARMRKELANSILPYKLLKWDQQAKQKIFDTEPTPFPEPWEVHPARLPPRVRPEDMPSDWKLMEDSIQIDFGAGMEDEEQTVADLQEEQKPSDPIRDEMNLDNVQLLDVIRKQLSEHAVETKAYGPFERKLKIHSQQDKLIPDNMHENTKDKLEQYQLKTLRQAQKYINVLQQNPDIDIDDIDKEYIMEERKRIEKQMAKEYEELRKAELGRAENERLQAIKLGEPTKYEIMQIRDRMNILLKRIELLEIKLEELGEIPESLWPLKAAYEIKDFHDRERAKNEASNPIEDEIPDVESGLYLSEHLDPLIGVEEQEEDLAEEETQSLLDATTKNTTDKISETETLENETETLVKETEALEKEGEEAVEDLLDSDTITDPIEAMEREEEEELKEIDRENEMQNYLLNQVERERAKEFRKLIDKEDVDGSLRDEVETEEAIERALEELEEEEDEEDEIDEAAQQDLATEDQSSKRSQTKAIAGTTKQATPKENAKDLEEIDEDEDLDEIEFEDLDEDVLPPVPKSTDPKVLAQYEANLNETFKKQQKELVENLDLDDKEIEEIDTKDVEEEEDEEFDEDLEEDEEIDEDLEEDELAEGFAENAALEEITDALRSGNVLTRAEARREVRAHRKATGKKARIQLHEMEDETQPLLEEEEDPEAELEKEAEEDTDAQLLDGSPFIQSRDPQNPVRHDPEEIKKDAQYHRDAEKYRRRAIADEIRFGEDQAYPEGLNTFKEEIPQGAKLRSKKPKISLTVKQIQSLPDSEVRRYLYTLDKQYRAKLRQEDEFRGDIRLEQLAQEVEIDDATFRAAKLADYSLPPIETTRPDPWNTLITILEEYKREFAFLTENLRELHEELEQQRFADQYRFKSDAQGRPLGTWFIENFNVPIGPRGTYAFTQLDSPDTIGFALAYHKLLFDYQNNVAGTTIPPMRSLDGISYPYYLWKATPFDLGPPEHRVGYTGVHQTIATQQEILDSEKWTPEDEAEFQRFVQSAKYHTPFADEELSEPLPRSVMEKFDAKQVDADSLFADLKNAQDEDKDLEGVDDTQLAEEDQDELDLDENAKEIDDEKDDLEEIADMEALNELDEKGELDELVDDEDEEDEEDELEELEDVMDAKDKELMEKVEEELEDDADPLEYLSSKLDTLVKQEVARELRALKLSDEELIGAEEEDIQRLILTEKDKLRYIKKRMLSVELRGFETEKEDNQFYDNLVKSIRDIQAETTRKIQREKEKALAEYYSLPKLENKPKREPGALKPRKYSKSGLELRMEARDTSRDEQWVAAHLLLAAKKDPSLLSDSKSHKDLITALVAELQARDPANLTPQQKAVVEKEIAEALEEVQRMAEDEDEEEEEQEADQGAELKPEDIVFESKKKPGSQVSAQKEAKPAATDAEKALTTGDKKQLAEDQKGKLATQEKDELAEDEEDELAEDEEDDEVDEYEYEDVDEEEEFDEAELKASSLHGELGYVFGQPIVAEHEFDLDEEEEDDLFNFDLAEDDEDPDFVEQLLDHDDIDAIRKREVAAFEQAKLESKPLLPGERKEGAALDELDEDEDDISAELADNAKLDFSEFDIMADMDEFILPDHDEELDLLMEEIPDEEKREIIDYQLLDEWDEMETEDDMEELLEENFDEEVETLRKKRLQALQNLVEKGWKDNEVVLHNLIPVDRSNTVHEFLEDSPTIDLDLDEDDEGEPQETKNLAELQEFEDEMEAEMERPVDMEDIEEEGQGEEGEGEEGQEGVESLLVDAEGKPIVLREAEQRGVDKDEDEDLLEEAEQELAEFKRSKAEAAKGEEIDSAQSPDDLLKQMTKEMKQVERSQMKANEAFQSVLEDTNFIGEALATEEQEGIDGADEEVNDIDEIDLDQIALDEDVILDEKAMENVDDEEKYQAEAVEDLGHGIEEEDEDEGEDDDFMEEMEEEDEAKEMEAEVREELEDATPVRRSEVKAMLLDVEDDILWDGLPKNMLEQTMDGTGYKEIKNTQRKLAEEAHKSEDPLVQFGWERFDPEFAEYLKQKQTQTLYQKEAEAKYNLEQVVRRRQMRHYLSMTPAQFEREKKRLQRIMTYRLGVLHKKKNKSDLDHAEIKKYTEWKANLELNQVEFVQKMLNASDAELEEMQEVAKAEQKKQVIKAQREALKKEREKQGPIAIPLPEYIDSWSDDDIFKGLAKLRKKIEDLQTDKELNKEEQYDLRQFSRMKKALESILTLTTIDKATNYQPFLEALSDDQLHEVYERVKDHVRRFNIRVRRTPAFQKPIAQKYYNIISAVKAHINKLLPPTFYHLKKKEFAKSVGLEENLSKRTMNKLIEQSKEEKEKEIESEIKLGKLKLYAFDEDTTPIRVSRQQVEQLYDILPRTHELVRQLKCTFVFRRLAEEPSVYEPLMNKLRQGGSLEVLDSITLPELMKDSDFEILDELQHIWSKEYQEKLKPVIDQPDFVKEFPDPLINGDREEKEKKFYEDPSFAKKARKEEIEFLNRFSDMKHFIDRPKDELLNPQKDMEVLETRKKELLKEKEEIEQELAKEDDAEAKLALDSEHKDVLQELEEVEEDKSTLEEYIKNGGKINEDDLDADFARRVAQREPVKLPLDGLTEFQKAILINHQASFGGTEEVDQMLLKVAKRLHEYNEEKKKGLVNSANNGPTPATTAYAAPVASGSTGGSATPATGAEGAQKAEANPMGFTPKALKFLKDIGMHPTHDAETLKRQETVFKKVAESAANFLKQTTNQEEFVPEEIWDYLDPTNHMLNLMELKWQVKDDGKRLLNTKVIFAGLYQGRRHVLQKKLQEEQKKAVMSASMRAQYQALGPLVKPQNLTQEYPFQFTFTRRIYGQDDEKRMDRKVILRVKVAALNLPPAAHDRLIQLAGKRYRARTDTLKLVMDKFAFKHYNTYGVKKLFTDLLDEAWKADPNYVPLEQEAKPQIVHELVKKLHQEAKENKNYFVFNTAYIPILQNTPPAVIQ